MKDSYLSKVNHILEFSSERKKQIHVCIAPSSWYHNASIDTTIFGSHKWESKTQNDVNIRQTNAFQSVQPNCATVLQTRLCVSFCCCKTLFAWILHKVCAHIGIIIMAAAVVTTATTKKVTQILHSTQEEQCMKEDGYVWLNLLEDNTTDKAK